MPVKITLLESNEKEYSSKANAKNDCRKLLPKMSTMSSYGNRPVSEPLGFMCTLIVDFANKYLRFFVGNF